MELEDILSDPRTPKPAKCYAYGPSNRASSPPRGSTAHLSPCCQSPCMRPHPKSTPSTPCPAPSPVAATPRSPAISPSPSQLPKAVESQEKRVEGQPPQDYPQSMEPGKELSLQCFYSCWLVIVLSVAVLKLRCLLQVIMSQKHMNHMLVVIHADPFMQKQSGLFLDSVALCGWLYRQEHGWLSCW